MIRRTRVPRSTDVRLTFTLPVDVPPGPVSVVGSFNGWTPGTHALRTRGSGVRSAGVVVPAGTDVHFRYLAAEGHWFDDADADSITDAGGYLHHVEPTTTSGSGNSHHGARRANSRT